MGIFSWLFGKKKAAPRVKMCSCCSRYKSIDDFGIDKHQPDKHNTRCKTCRNRAAKVSREKAKLAKRKIKHAKRRNK